MSEEKNTKEMELLLSEQEIKVDGKVVVVHKLAMLDTIRLASQMSSLAAAIVNNSDTAANAIGKLAVNSGDANSDNAIRLIGMIEILGLVGEDAADLIQNIVVKSTNLDYDEAEAISAEEGLDLLFKIYEVNKSFFKKFLQKLKEKTKNLVQKEEEEKPKKTSKK
jgi:hypothetical protein